MSGNLDCVPGGDLKIGFGSATKCPSPRAFVPARLKPETRSRSIQEVPEGSNTSFR